jgi:membrane-bound lytic murein transglycosylase D
VAEGGRDLHWMEGLEMPDLPVRWEPHLVKYLEFFKSDPRGRQLFAVWLRRSGRYRESMRRALRQKGLPEDLVWLSMIESGFDATARSPVGAGGLWQFMPQTGKLYGLAQDRWLDERFDPQRATLAAADFLADLHRRFGSWELAIASYNMGYGGMLSVVKRYNTNDYWALSRLEAALPWETTLYVPKIVAAAIVARNLKTFGFADAAVDAPLDGDEVAVPPGVALSAVAQAAGTTAHELEIMNPQYRAGRTPPEPSSSGGYPVRVPDGRGDTCTAALARMKTGTSATDRYVVRFGDTLEQIAAAHKTTAARLAELNGIRAGEMVHGGAVLLVPHATSTAMATATGLAANAVGSAGGNGPATSSSAGSEDGAKVTTVVVPADVFVYPDRKRVFYRVAVGDTLKDVAGAFHVSADELRRWNDLDPVARLHDGMTLQLFVAPETDLSSVAVLAESQVRVVPVGSEDFFASWDGMKGRRRVSIPAKAGDTLATLSRRLGVPVTSLERINRRGATEPYAAGDEVIVYLPDGLRGPDGATLPGTLDSKEGPTGPDPLGPLPDAPSPASLPAIAPPLPAFIPRHYRDRNS